MSQILPSYLNFPLGHYSTDTLQRRSGSSAKMQLFLVVSTCLLYLVAAGLFSRAVGYFEQQEW